MTKTANSEHIRAIKFSSSCRGVGKSPNIEYARKGYTPLMSDAPKRYGFRTKSWGAPRGESKEHPGWTHVNASAADGVTDLHVRRTKRSVEYFAVGWIPDRTPLERITD